MFCNSLITVSLKINWVNIGEEYGTLKKSRFLKVFAFSTEKKMKRNFNEDDIAWEIYYVNGTLSKTRVM